MDHKSVNFGDCDLKMGEADEGVFEGYLSVFGNVDSYGDTIIKGAYEETLNGMKRLPPMLLNHDQHSVPIGIWKSMKEDDKGLRVVGELTKGHAVADQVWASMKHGSLTGMSIGYRATKYEENAHGGLDLHAIKLIEGSVVTMPADDHARVDLLKFEDEYGTIESLKEFEIILRDAGYSRKLAKSLVSQFKELCQRDAGGDSTEFEAMKAKLARLERRDRLDSRLAKIEALI